MQYSNRTTTTHVCISLEGIGHYYVVLNFSDAKITSNFVKQLRTYVTPWITYDKVKNVQWQVKFNSC